MLARAAAITVTVPCKRLGTACQHIRNAYVDGGGQCLVVVQSNATSMVHDWWHTLNVCYVMSLAVVESTELAAFIQLSRLQRMELVVVGSLAWVRELVALPIFVVGNVWGSNEVDLLLLLVTPSDDFRSAFGL